MTYEEHAPPVWLHDRVEALWRFTVEASDPASFLHVVPPDGATNIFIANGDPAAPPMAVGPACRAAHVPVARGLIVAGLRLRPGGAWRIGTDCVMDPAGLLPDGTTPIVGPLASWCRYALSPLLDNGFDAAAERVASWPLTGTPPRTHVLRAVLRLTRTHGRVPIRDLSDAVSARTLRRHFVLATGLSPRTFASVRRLRHACMIAVVAGEDLAGVSLKAGYADQPHLSREMAKSFSMSPGVAMRYLGTIRHRLLQG